RSADEARQPRAATSVSSIARIAPSSHPSLASGEATTAGTGVGAGTASGLPTTSEGPTTSSDSAPKFDLEGPPQSDFGGPDDGPIIPETCVQADAGKSTVGCKFYAVDMDSHDQVETSPYAVAVANVQLPAPANVTIATKAGGMWTVVAGPQPIEALSLHSFELPDRHIDDSGVNVGGSYRVTSDVPAV